MFSTSTVAAHSPKVCYYSLKEVFEEVKQLFHCFLTRKEMEKLQSNSFPPQEGQGELFPWPASQRGLRSQDPSLLVPCLQTLSVLLPWVTQGWGQCWPLNPSLQALSSQTAIFYSHSDSHHVWIAWDFLKFLEKTHRAARCVHAAALLRGQRDRELHTNLRGACVKDIGACWLKISIW